MSTAIKIENLSKKYIIGHQRQGQFNTLRDVLTHTLYNLGQRIRHPLSTNQGHVDQEELWAIRDINLEINQGERIGIIGRNGAGKSTLLKVLSRITEPTEGRFTTNGRVASLLEVGTGFHPELSGRENIFLNGAILGMSKAEIKSRFDEIVEFAGTEKFLDTPVKRYSSGMYVRLAFAIAAHLEPEILIVDEVLAVGDISFQEKCLGKLKTMDTDGRTVIFVSHNMAAIKMLCSSVILLSSGKIESLGDPDRVVDFYLGSVSDQNENTGEVRWANMSSAPGGDEMRLVSIRLLNDINAVRHHFDTGKPIKIEICYQLYTIIKGMRFILQIISMDGAIAFTSADYGQRADPTTPGLYQTSCIIPAELLNSGLYSVKIHSGCPGVKVLIEGQEFLTFSTERASWHGSSFPEKWPGVVAPRLSWSTVKIND